MSYEIFPCHYRFSYDADKPEGSVAGQGGIRVKCLKVQCPFLTVSGDRHGDSNGNYKFFMHDWVRKFPDKPVYKHENDGIDRYINWKESGFWSIGLESMINDDYDYKHRSMDYSHIFYKTKRILYPKSLVY